MTSTTSASEARTGPQPLPVAGTGLGRLYRGQTSIDSHGRRRIGAWISLVLLVLGIGSLLFRGLDLGIDFEGGVSWDVPSAEFTITEAERVLTDNGLDAAGARIQQRASDSGAFIKVQVGVQDPEVLGRLQTAFAAEAGVGVDDVSVNAVSSSWGRDVTNRAIRALVFFTAAVALFISIRYEWRMALAAIVAMVHDVVIAVGIYSLLGFVVTPATVVAFLTILGYSLYDTIVIFDRVRENETRFEGRRPPYADIINTTLNQVLMRTINTSISSMIPVLSILVIGAGLLGASALAEFAIALLVGMFVGAYSSLFVAAPLLGLLKQTDDRWRSDDSLRARGPALRELVVGGAPPGRRTRQAAAKAYLDERSGDDTDRADEIVDEIDPRGAGAAGQPRPVPLRPTHPPRPRKKKKR